MSYCRIPDIIQKVESCNERIKADQNLNINIYEYII